MFEEWMLRSAYQCLAEVLSVNPVRALAEIERGRKAILCNRRKRGPWWLCMLSCRPTEALSVLALSKQIVLKINKPFVTRLHDPVLLAEVEAAGVQKRKAKKRFRPAGSPEA